MNEEDKLKDIANTLNALANSFSALAESAQRTRQTIIFLQEENARLTEKLHKVGDIFREY